MYHAINEYYRVTFRDFDEGTQFAFAAVQIREADRPLSVFGPGMFGGDDSGWVSEGTRDAIRLLMPRLQISGTPTLLKDLPDGLSFLRGEDRERIAYENRHSTK